MKILRIRRGFTTNSSAYTEWLPPETTTGTSTSPAGPNAPAPTATGGTPQSSLQPAAVHQAPAQAGSHLGGNLLVVSGILAALAGVFILERMLRGFRNREPDTEVDE